MHLTVSFMVWLLIGALSISLARELQLSDQQVAWLVALPLLGGAGLRMLAGWSADWVGARPTALVILLAELAALLWGWLGVSGYHEALLFALLLGVAGASFAVSLPIAGRAYPPAAQGFVLGLAASANVGTVLILFLAPRWAAVMDWHHVCAVMAGIVGVTLVLFPLLVPREQPSWRPIVPSGGTMRRNSSAAGLPIGSVSCMPSHSVGLSDSAVCCRCYCTTSISWTRSWLGPSQPYADFSAV